MRIKLINRWNTLPNITNLEFNKFWLKIDQYKDIDWKYILEGDMTWKLKNTSKWSRAYDQKSTRQGFTQTPTFCTVEIYACYFNLQDYHFSICIMDW